MKWNRKDAHDQKVVEDTGWRNLTNFRSFQDRAGVYIFANSALQVKYIGKAGAGRIVDEISNASYRRKDSGATKVKVLYTNSGPKALSLERDLINEYDPLNNVL